MVVSSGVVDGVVVSTKSLSVVVLHPPRTNAALAAPMAAAEPFRKSRRLTLEANTLSMSAIILFLPFLLPSPFLTRALADAVPDAPAAHEDPAIHPRHTVETRSSAPSPDEN